LVESSVVVSDVADLAEALVVAGAVEVVVEAEVASERVEASDQPADGIDHRPFIDFTE
jgi:hypothetical protein